VLGILFALLAGYGIDNDEDAVDAARMVRAALHGFVDLEQLGGTKCARASTRATAAWGRRPRRCTDELDLTPSISLSRPSVSLSRTRCGIDARRSRSWTPGRAELQRLGQRTGRGRTNGTMA
jgi:hypothetical protein